MGCLGRVCFEGFGAYGCVEVYRGPSKGLAPFFSRCVGFLIGFVVLLSFVRVFAYRVQGIRASES